MRAAAAQQEGGARRGQIGIGGVIPTGLGEPAVVDRMQAAQHRDDVRPAQRIVFGHHHQVPVPRIEPRVEDLYDLAATLPQQPGGQRRLTAAAHGQDGRCRKQRGEGLAVTAFGARPASRRGPAPGRTRVQGQGIEAGVASEQARKRIGLTGVAGAAIADRVDAS